MSDETPTSLFEFAMSDLGMLPEQRRLQAELERLAAARVSAESKWLDEGIAALIRAGAPLERITVEYWPQGKGDDPTPFSRVVVRDPSGVTPGGEPDGG